MSFTPSTQIANALLGIYYGFSKPAVAAFFHRRWMMERGVPQVQWPTSKGTPFDGTGYIPTGEDLIMGYDATIAAINSRRISPYPFNDPRVNVDELHYDQWLEEIRSPEYQPRIREYFVYLMERDLLALTPAQFEAFFSNTRDEFNRVHL